MRQKQSSTERETLDWIVACSNKAPGGLQEISCHSMVRMVRQRLGMTQAQLAERVDLPQSHIAKIEAGGVDIQIGTMKRIFKALHCEPIMLPRPVRPIDEILEEQAQAAAEKKVARELKQNRNARFPIGKEERRRRVEEEKWKLMQSLSSEIWDK